MAGSLLPDTHRFEEKVIREYPYAILDPIRPHGLGRNPFGFTAIDIKAFYLGVTGCSWSNTRSSAIARELRPALAGDHNALHDARYQAELFRLTRQLGEKIRCAGTE